MKLIIFFKKILRLIVDMLDILKIWNLIINKCKTIIIYTKQMTISKLIETITSFLS